MEKQWLSGSNSQWPGGTHYALMVAIHLVDKHKYTLG